MTQETIHAIVAPGVRAPRRRGFAGHQQRLAEEDVVTSGGLRWTSPARTFCDLADMLALPDLVALGDRVARRTSLADVAAAVQRHPRASRRRDEALELLDPRAESPKESELRVALIRAGIGPLAANHVVFDLSGAFVARVDLALAALRIAIEYEGDHHRDPHQWRRDISRRRRLEALGWIYIPVTQADLNTMPALLADIRTAIASRA